MKTILRFVMKRKLFFILLITAGTAVSIYVQYVIVSNGASSADRTNFAPSGFKSGTVNNGYKRSSIATKLKVETETTVERKAASAVENDKRNTENVKCLTKEESWWKYDIIYQIYTRSFQDSDGDGNGDIKGITQRLNYFKYLGVGVLYLNLFHVSPTADQGQGYEISDFMAIDPLFGSMTDFEELVKCAHERDLKIVIDFVPNHTSDKHPWFVKSRSSKESDYRDWYVWKDPDEPWGAPPTNWVSVGGGVPGSMWTLDRQTSQYYLHQHAQEQPDLNLHHPDVRSSLKEVLAFWMRKGVDGFRVDSVAKFFEDPLWRDEHKFRDHDPSEPLYNQIDHSRTTDMPDTHKILGEWREYMNTFPSPYRLMMGEVILKDINRVTEYYGSFKEELDFPLSFALVKLKSNFNAAKVERLIKQYVDEVPYGKWMNWFTGTEDTQRLGSRVGEQYIRAFIVLLLTLPGTPIVYYGEEIGMMDGDIPVGGNPVEYRGRDLARSPMQWSGNTNAGFSNASVSTWLPLASNYRGLNVQKQTENPTSTLQLFRKLAALRCNEAAFRSLELDIFHSDESALAYIRWEPGSSSKYLIVVNLGKTKRTGAFSGSGTVIVDSNFKQEGKKIHFSDLVLAVGQAMVISVN